MDVTNFSRAANVGGSNAPEHSQGAAARLRNSAQAQQDSTSDQPVSKANAGDSEHGRDQEFRAHLSPLMDDSAAAATSNGGSNGRTLPSDGDSSPYSEHLVDPAPCPRIATFIAHGK